MNSNQLGTLELLLNQTSQAQEELKEQERRQLLGESLDFSRLGNLLWAIEKNLELLKNN